MSTQTLPVTLFATPEWLRDYFKTNYGPTIAAYRGLADQPDQAVALDEELTDLARRFRQRDGPMALEWEYLLVTGRRR